MNIIMISGDTALIRGIQGAFYNTLRGFHTFWDRIDVICPYVSHPQLTEVFGNVFFHPLPKKKFLAPYAILRKGIELHTRVRSKLIVAHCYGPQLMSLGGWLLACKLNVPLVLEVHHVEGYPRAATLLDYLMRWMTLLFIWWVKNDVKAFRVVNNELISILQSLGVPPKKVHVLYSVYLDKNIFHPLQDVPKKYDLIFVGRLTPNKGLPLLLKTFSLLKTNTPTVQLLIIGKGPKEEWLKRCIHIHDLQGITYIPSLSFASDLTQAYNQSKIIVCTSLAEGGPRVVVEAMACGVPPVSTPVGLMKEIIRNTENGFLMSGWSPQELTDRIIQLLSSPTLYQKCSQNAIAVAEQFDYTRTISQYGTTYQQFTSL